MKPLFKILAILVVSVIIDSCSLPKMVLLDTEYLKIEQITKNTYLHITYLDIPNYGKFACNGLIYLSGKEAFVFDTPPENAVAEKLIQWIKKELDATVEAVIINHFHNDCLGGLAAFHDRNIPSYSSARTQTLARRDSVTIPTKTFESHERLFLKDNEIMLAYMGEAHTKDNIVAWIQKDLLLFGGCMVKSLGASKGNTADANVEKWSDTIRKIKAHFQKVKYVIPGHGKYGGVELLDYTIELFSK